MMKETDSQCIGIIIPLLFCIFMISYMLDITDTQEHCPITSINHVSCIMYHPMARQKTLSSRPGTESQKSILQILSN